MSNDVREPSGHLVRELHGITLAEILAYLVEQLGFEQMAERVKIRCFSDNPSVSSSLTFLRRTPWARAEVESLYVAVRSKELSSQSARHV